MVNAATAIVDSADRRIGFSPEQVLRQWKRLTPAAAEILSAHANLTPADRYLTASDLESW